MRMTHDEVDDIVQRIRAETGPTFDPGVKTRRQAAEVIAGGDVDLVGLARTMVLDPDLATTWLSRCSADPEFPTFDSPPPGGVTAWYTTRLTALGQDREGTFDRTLDAAVTEYETRDAGRVAGWTTRSGSCRL